MLSNVWQNSSCRDCIPVSIIACGTERPQVCKDLIFCEIRRHKSGLDFRHRKLSAVYFCSAQGELFFIGSEALSR